MNRKSFLPMMQPAILCGLLILITAGNANSQMEESLSINFCGPECWRMLNIQISIKGVNRLERAKFLEDPVSTLRKERVQVPESAEAPWRKFTETLRRLSNSKSARPAAGPKRSGAETI